MIAMITVALDRRMRKPKEMASLSLIVKRICKFPAREGKADCI